MLEDNPVGRLKVFIYDLPRKYNKKMVTKDPRCLSHMFAAEIFMHRFLLSSAVRTLNPKEADWFYTPVYTTCDLTNAGLPLPFKSPRVMRSAIQYISNKWPFWNRTDGADHFFVVPHDFAACFHYQVSAHVHHAFHCVQSSIFPFIALTTISLRSSMCNDCTNISRKKRLLSVEFFRCCDVLHWSKLLDRRIMFVSRRVPSLFHPMLLRRKCKLT